MSTPKEPLFRLPPTPAEQATRTRTRKIQSLKMGMEFEIEEFKTQLQASVDRLMHAQNDRLAAMFALIEEGGSHE